MKNNKPKVGKALPMQRLIDFTLADDHIISKGAPFHFFRYFPPNISIMTTEELEKDIDRFGRLLDALNCKFSLFITDKIEDLNENKKFYSSLSPEFEYITSEIVAAIESTEVESTSVQRAFYFIYKPPKNHNYEDFYNTLVGRGYRIAIPNRQELAMLLRNYTIREFINQNIYTIVQEAAAGIDKRVKDEVFNREILRRLLPYRIDFYLSHAEQSGFLRKTIMIKNFPAEIAPAALQGLAKLRGTTFTMRFTPMNKNEARTLVDQQLKNKKTGRFSNSNTKRIESDLDADAIKNFYSSVARSQSSVYRINIFIEMCAKNKEELRLLEERVNQEIGGAGCSSEELKYEQRQGFESVQPLGNDLFLSAANNMPSNTAAALYPCSYSSRHDTRGMLLGRTAQGGNFFLDILKWDNYITTGSLTTTGKSGQGKSWLQKKISTFLYMFGVSSYILDVEDEYIDVVKGLGGTIINPIDGKVKMNPFQIRTFYTEEDKKETGFDFNPNTPVFFQHLSWLKDFFSVLFPTMSVDKLKALMVFVQDMYIAHGITEKTDISHLKPTNYPTFSTLYNFIDEGSHQRYAHLMSDEMIRSIRLNIKDCHDGPMSVVMNGHTNIKNHRLVCFSLLRLLEGDKERTDAVLFNITSYVWDIVLKRQGHVELKVEEMHMFLENPIMMKYLNSYQKRARKYGALLSLSTQQIEECLSEKNVDKAAALFNQASFNFFFYPGEIDTRVLKEKLKLTDGEIKCISQPNKRHCLVKAGIDRYYIEVGDFKYEHLLFGDAGGM